MRATRRCVQHTGPLILAPSHIIWTRRGCVCTSITTLNCHFCTSCVSGPAFISFHLIEGCTCEYITHYYNNKMHICLTIFIWNQSVIQLSQQPIQMIWQWVSSFIFMDAHRYTTGARERLYIWYSGVEWMCFGEKRKENRVTNWMTVICCNADLSASIYTQMVDYTHKEREEEREREITGAWELISISFMDFITHWSRHIHSIFRRTLLIRFHCDLSSDFYFPN